MLKKYFILALILCTANMASAFNLYSQTGKEKSFNLGLRYLLVQNKYYPAFEATGYLSYAGIGLHIGKIYSKQPFTEFGNTKDLGYFWGVNVYTKISLNGLSALRLVPGFEFSGHKLTSVDDNVSYHLSSLYLALEAIVFKRIRLEYALMFPVFHSSEIELNKSGVLSLIRIHYFLFGE